MGCEDYDSSVRRLLHVDVRQQVLYVSNDEIDAAGMHRVENVFWRESRHGLTFYFQISGQKLMPI